MVDDSTDTESTQPDAEEEPIDPARLNAEIEELGDYIRWARSIGVDTKTRALLTALDVGFAELEKAGAAPKAVVFTESRRTQAYLKDFLEGNGYAGSVVTFSGTNNDPDSTQLYRRWAEENADSGRASGSRAVDVRTAIIDEFRGPARIMIATEAAAEGINLQFCSLVINFDLPWNPQRIEQRIGRCHRYGQKNDVVVINFLNERNDADRRVYELLEQKFHLFDGVFGASDDVLGTIESGVDFERRVFDIYQQCRSTEEIEAAFKSLQTELDETIQQRIEATRQILLEHFDEDVHARLRFNLDGARARLDAIGHMFWVLTRFILAADAVFDDQQLEFDLQRSPVPAAKPGRYQLISKQPDVEQVVGEFLYRLSHPLGQHVLLSGKTHPAPPAEVIFDISGHPTRISLVEELRGHSGVLTLTHLRVDSFDREEYLLFSGYADDGRSLDQETCEKLFLCNARVVPDAAAVGETIAGYDISDRLVGDADRHVRACLNRSLEQNNRHFNEAREKLEQWAEDMEIAAQKELDDTKNQIRATSREARLATTMDEQKTLQDKVRSLEQKKRKLRQQIFDIEDEIAVKRDQLIDSLERRMQQTTESKTLFHIRWRVT
ncbi:helicase domain-containing protein [Rhodopirellula maiorica SM1]|uniref:Helicase domain-containing protein n=1 Tax=Rhodopirellula maiorica SM1 TaxID=1265738 RepID=M5RGM0_9BACT|nr:helicase domain-containing protein [Rhodopirellula maiorica SM1]